MSRYNVSLVRYEKPLESVSKAVELCGGLTRISASAKVFIKPNIVYWTKEVPFPKWGVITIGEGMVMGRPGDQETPAHAFLTLGYQELGKRFGVKVINTFERPFQEVDLGQDIKLSFNVDALHSDFVVDLPVMKTHAQTMVSLGIKNLKGLIDVNSRKRCHSTDLQRGLHFWVSHMHRAMPPVFTLIDGIFTAERGPGLDGIMHRSNLLAASWDVLSADLVGARLLGQDPAQVPYLAQAAHRAGRPLDLSDVEVIGERLEDLAKPHEWSFPYNADDSLPLLMAQKGISGVSFYKYDSTMCTYCSTLNGVLLSAIAMAWRGQPWDQVEVLTGKMMLPRPGAKKTVLLGKCMYQAHKDNPDIALMIPVKGCPPKPEQIVEAMHKAGIMVDPTILLGMERLPGMFMKRYQGKPEFDEGLFRVA